MLTVSSTTGAGVKVWATVDGANLGSSGQHTLIDLLADYISVASAPYLTKAPAAAAEKARNHSDPNCEQSSATDPLAARFAFLAVSLDNADS